MGEFNRVEGAPSLAVSDGSRASRQHSASRVQATAPLPFVTGVLLASVVIVFLAMWRAGHGNVMEVALQFGDKESSLIQRGEWWRLITPIFLHGSWTHLIVNGLSLVWFGSQIERLYGARRYFLIFMVAGVVGNLLSYWRLPTPSLGASGSLFGLVGAGIVLPLRYRHLIAEEARSTILRQLVTVAAINFAISFSPGIDIWAHLGGFIGGGVAALFLMPPVLDDRPPSALRDAALTVVTLLVLGVTLLAGLLQWRVAGRDAQEDTVNYIVADYWTVGIPARWQTRTVPGSAGLWWITPDRATLNIRDIPHRPDLNLTRQAWSQMGVVQPITIDGRNALTMGRQTNDGTEYLCVISAYDHEIDIAIDSSPAGYQDAHDDYERILSSIHVLHPPPPTAPNVATGSGLAVPDSSTP